MLGSERRLAVWGRYPRPSGRRIGNHQLRSNPNSETDNKSCKGGVPGRSLRDAAHEFVLPGSGGSLGRGSGGSSSTIATGAGLVTYVLLIPNDTAEVDSESATIGSLVR